MDEKELIEQEYAKDMKINYISFLALYVASNIDALYCRFNNNYDMSLDTMINDSKDQFVLNQKDTQLLYKLIDKALEDEYSLKITNRNKLTVKEISNIGDF